MKILVTTTTARCRYGGALYAMDLEKKVHKTYWFHPPTVATFPKSQDSHRGVVCYGLTGMCWRGDLLYVARWSDILVLKLHGGFPPDHVEIVDILTHPLMNDIHDIRDDGDGLLVVCSGTETILSIDDQGRERDRWHVDPGERAGENARLIPGLAYNKYSSTKPHALHTNMVVRHQGNLYATVCQAGEIARLLSNGRREAILSDLKMPHDGEFFNEGRNFAVTSAESMEFHYFAVDDNRYQEIARIPVPGDWRGRGWLRGVLQISSHRYLVGMSVWKHSPSYSPARIFELDTKEQKILRRWRLPAIHDCPDVEYRSPLGPAVQWMSRIFRRPFYGNPNVFKMVLWKPSRREVT